MTSTPVRPAAPLRPHPRRRFRVGALSDAVPRTTDLKVIGLTHIITTFAYCMIGSPTQHAATGAVLEAGAPIGRVFRVARP